MSFKEYAGRGRTDGRNQIHRKQDMMTVYSWRVSKQEWIAYLTAFYRACGHSGSGNRRQRRYANGS